jgi:hypothetical protein
VKKHLVIVAIALAAVALAPAAFAATTGLTGAKAALADANPDLAVMLTYAIQDERIARAEYQAIIGKLGSVRPFANIIRAEKTHIGYLEDLFTAFKLALPTDSTPAMAAPRDFAAALEAGRQAEIDNIAMYDRFLSRELPADVRQVFVQLKAASQNHLRAFTTNQGRSS